MNTSTFCMDICTQPPQTYVKYNESQTRGGLRTPMFPNSLASFITPSSIQVANISLHQPNPQVLLVFLNLFQNVAVSLHPHCHWIKLVEAWPTSVPCTTVWGTWKVEWSCHLAASHCFWDPRLSGLIYKASSPATSKHWATYSSQNVFFFLKQQWPLHHPHRFSS